MIKVEREVYTTPWSIKNFLTQLVDVPLMAFDTETSGLYSKAQRKEAMKLLDTDINLYMRKLASIVANNSGLSFPALVRTTHFVFGVSTDKSIILVPDNPHCEILVWNWVRDYRGKLLIHNCLFDLKIMFHRIEDLPYDYDDTALMVKTLINNSDVWKAKIGLKDLMGEYYAPAWSVFDTYEPDDPLNASFLDYAAIDGAATYHLHKLILERS